MNLDIRQTIRLLSDPGSLEEIGQFCQENLLILLSLRKIRLILWTRPVDSKSMSMDLVIDLRDKHIWSEQYISGDFSGTVQSRVPDLGELLVGISVLQWAFSTDQEVVQSFSDKERLLVYHLLEEAIAADLGRASQEFLNRPH